MGGVIVSFSCEFQALLYLVSIFCFLSLIGQRVTVDRQTVQKTRMMKYEGNVHDWVKTASFSVLKCWLLSCRWFNVNGNMVYWRTVRSQHGKEKTPPPHPTHTPVVKFTKYAERL